MPAADTAFWFDWGYDRANADPGTSSRFGNYLHRSSWTRALQEIDHDEPGVEFAATVWRIATSPVMVPGLIRWHPRISTVGVSRSGWNGELVASVGLVSPRPAPLRNMRDSTGAVYGDVRLDSWGTYEWPSEQDLTRRPYLTTEAQLMWQFSAGRFSWLTEVPTDRTILFSTAVPYLELLVECLNYEVSPVLALLEGQ
jgi:hypothetical protein